MSPEDRPAPFLYIVRSKARYIGPAHRRIDLPVPGFDRLAVDHVQSLNPSAILDCILRHIRLVLYTVILGSIGLAVVGSRIIAIRAQPLSARLADCAGNPCFHNAIPGLTSWSEAIAAFDGRSTVADDASYLKITLFPSEHNNQLAAIMLEHPLGQAVTVGAILKRYGTPTCVSVSQHPGVVILHYPAVHFMTRPVQNVFGPLTRISTIVIGTPVYSSGNQSPACQLLPASRSSQHTWHGFAALEYYNHSD